MATLQRGQAGAGGTAGQHWRGAGTHAAGVGRRCGAKQGICWVAQAAVLLANQPNLCFVLCGDGAMQPAAQATCGHLPQVRFMPLQPLSQLGSLLGLADCSLLDGARAGL